MENTQNKPYRILLYYCYASIIDPRVYRKQHHLFCAEHNIRGRIIVSDEGLNGTVSGLAEDCDAYMAYVKSDPRFAATEFKIDSHEEHTFTKIHVRYKPEIVHSSLRHLDPNVRTGKHLEPADFKQLKDEEDVVILDVRSKYEHDLGHFKNSLTLDIDNFREFPKRVRELAHLKNKKVLTYCTGGIKCEKASAYLLEQGFTNVYQLHGGIIKYGLELGGEDFQGKCYVFDTRIAVAVNQVNPTVVSTCHICNIACERMINCANAGCNDHIALCEACGWELEGACSPACQAYPNKRHYDGTGIYQRAANGYNPFQSIHRDDTKNRYQASHGQPANS